MIEEVKVRAQEEAVELKMLPALTNKVTSSFASSSSIPTAAGIEGMTEKPCARCMADQGCQYGRKCQHDHPPGMSRK
eukprot:7422718-Prorocentrum_lima.AAC.1